MEDCLFFAIGKMSGCITTAIAPYSEVVGERAKKIIIALTV
jgi:hypothetical protein